MSDSEQPVVVEHFVVEALGADESRAVRAEYFDQHPEVYGDYFPNALRIMARSPALLEAVNGLGEVVLQRPGRVDRGLKFMVAGISSQAAGCRYCQVHSLRNGTKAGVPVDKIEALWLFETSELFDDAERAALRLAQAAGVSPNAVTPTHFDELHRHFDDDQIVELVAVICLYGFFNRWNDTFAVPLEQVPLDFGKSHLSSLGWEPGRHVHDE